MIKIVISHEKMFRTVCRFEMDSHSYRASDNTREKKSNFVGFLETNSRRKRPISREFFLEFSGQISPKNKEKSQEERFQKKKDILEGCEIQGKKENTKVQ